MTKHALRPDLTFKANAGLARHGWLRLTPAYSAHLVREIVGVDPRGPVLDPFVGTGTTVLVAAEHGLAAHGVDINPFLVWLCETKAICYSHSDIQCARERLRAALASTRFGKADSDAWHPPMNNITKWWGPDIPEWLGAVYRHLGLAEDITSPAQRLLAVVFCRIMISSSNASFGHQSMSLKARHTTLFSPADLAHQEAERVLNEAALPLSRTERLFFLGDSRDLRSVLRTREYPRVVTSPPYANRVSYLRELRPYMLWLRFLRDPREAGELDWRAIGGTWGCATSNMAKWEPDVGDIARVFDVGAFQAIRRRSDVLARYLVKYFVDIEQHIRSLWRVLVPGARVDYIVG